MSLPKVARPLDGIRILAIEHMQAMPYATQLLGWLGADVVKVEPPLGEAGRTASPSLTDRDGQRVGATYLRNNLNKRSVCLNLKDPRGVDLALGLAGQVDALVENYRPGVLDRLGLGFADVHARIPALVYASVSGFGHDPTSPYYDWPAYAPIVETMAGFYELRRDGDDFPGRLGLGAAFGDICAAMFAAVGILSAIRHRERTGEGQHVDIAMFDAMVAFGDMICFMPSMGVEHPVRRPRGIVGGFRAADGYFVLAVLREHHFERLARLVGRPDWLTDPRLATRQDWVSRRDELIRPAVEAWAMQYPKTEAARRLAAEGIAAGPSFTDRDLRDDRHLDAHQMLVNVDRPDAPQPLVVSGQPIRFSATAAPARGRWPLLGEHTSEVLRELAGLDQAAIDALVAEGVIGPMSPARTGSSEGNQT